jgi:hypothetical protein
VVEKLNSIPIASDWMYDPFFKVLDNRWIDLKTIKMEKLNLYFRKFKLICKQF